MDENEKNLTDFPNHLFCFPSIYNTKSEYPKHCKHKHIYIVMHLEYKDNTQPKFNYAAQ